MRGDDGELGADVRLAQEGDERAFARVYRAVHPGILGRLRLVGDDAEDVAAEAWLEIARDLGRFRGDGHGFRGWAAAIARHRGLDHLRGRRRRPRPRRSGRRRWTSPTGTTRRPPRWSPCRPRRSSPWSGRSRGTRRERSCCTW